MTGQCLKPLDKILFTVPEHISLGKNCQPQLKFKLVSSAFGMCALNLTRCTETNQKLINVTEFIELENKKTSP